MDNLLYNAKTINEIKLKKYKINTFNITVRMN